VILISKNLYFKCCGDFLSVLSILSIS
jgi:hypothetical protein